MVARFSKGTFAKMDALRRPRETRNEFVRTAVDHELARREKERRGAERHDSAIQRKEVRITLYSDSP